MKEGRILALDVGEKTIGVAVTDATGSCALPLTTVFRRPGKKRDMAALRQLCAEHRPHAIVVGMPLESDGTAGKMAQRVECFIATLRNSVRVPIIRQDERLTTWEAENALISAGYRRSAERKAVVDSVAASLILRDYLEGEQLRRQSVSVRQEAET